MGQTIHILVADRNRHVRDFLRRELANEGYLVEVARDSREIFQKLSEDMPDVIILDIEIPDLMESDLLVKLHETHPHLPIIIHAFPMDDLSHLQAPNVFAFLEKKEDTARLKTVIAEATARYDFGEDISAKKT